MKSNWGAANGTALHWVLENYANACRGTHEDGTIVSKEDSLWMLDWKANILNIFERGHKHQTDKSFSILDLAKDKDYVAKPKNCQTCPYFKDNICNIAKENVDTLRGCPKYLYEDNLDLLSCFMKRMKKIYTKGKILGVEAEFDIDLGQNDIHGTPMHVLGFMDFIHEYDSETLEMIDYKAGSHTQTYDEVYNDIQARIYSLALRQKYPQYQNYMLTFDYLREKPVTVTYTPADDEVTKQRLIEKWTQIAAPQNVNRSIGWWCKAMCDKAKCDIEWPKFVEKFSKK